MNHSTRFAIALLVAPVLSACGGDEPPQAVEQPAGAMGEMQDMPMMEGAPGMGGMPMADGMMEQMQAHMAAMQGADGERFRTMLPQHRQMVANMVSQFNREMRDMRMDADSEWSETVEGLRQDLRQMPEMSAQELEGFLPEHRQRVLRLMEMHREMMGGMQM